MDTIQQPTKEILKENTAQSPLRLEQDQHGIVLANVELLLGYNFAGDSARGLPLFALALPQCDFSSGKMQRPGNAVDQCPSGESGLHQRRLRVRLAMS